MNTDTFITTKTGFTYFQVKQAHGKITQKIPRDGEKNAGIITELVCRLEDGQGGGEGLVQGMNV